MDSLTAQGGAYEKQREWLQELIKESDRPEVTSRYRHLLAAVEYKRSQELESAEHLDATIKVLEDDANDPQTQTAFREAAWEKIDAIVGYQVRCNDDDEDVLVVQEARRRGQTASIYADDSHTEVAMLREAFGRDDVVYLRANKILTFSEAIGDSTSTGIGHRFHSGPIIEAMEQGKVLVLDASQPMEARLKRSIQDFLQGAPPMIVDHRGITHIPTDGFMLVFLCQGSAERAAFPCQFNLDFRSWTPDSY